MLLLILSIRLAKLQLLPSKEVWSNYQGSQIEKVGNFSYRILDSEGKDMYNYKKSYVVVIDKKPFSLNNFEEGVENLIAFNYIMKNEISNFTFDEVIKNPGKTYYKISKETHDKINDLKELKGVYTYENNELDTSKAWTVENMLTIDKSDIVSGSIQSKISEYINNNTTISKMFVLDDKYVYKESNENLEKDNKNLKVTIDSRIQNEVKEVLNKEEYSKYLNIGVMIMESDTGKIRALAQKDDTAANINLAIEGSGFEPGSIFKLVTLAGALDKGLVNMSDTFTCKGDICKEVHGKMTVSDALTISCNDILADVAAEEGYDVLMDYSEKLGLFNRVLNLQSEGKNEAIGIKAERESGLNNIAIGQCITVSPIQMLGAVNTIVNNGVYVKPYLIDKIVADDGSVLENLTTEKKEELKKNTCKNIKTAMENVVNKGTGIKAKVNGLTIGGKTGSSTSGSKTTHGWFAGYFTVNEKTYTMIVFIPNISIVENGKDLGGGDTAAPVFRDIVKNMIGK